MSLRSGYIQVASRIVGEISVDSSEVSASGGFTSPQLVIRTKVELSNLPAEKQIAVASLRASLHWDSNASAQQQVCSPIDLSLRSNMNARSIPTGPPNESSVDLRFPLTQEQLVSLESARHAGRTEGGVNLYLRIEPHVVGLQTYGEGIGGRPQSQWGLEHGLHSIEFTFWSSSVTTITVEISRQTWIEKVLPGFGYDRLRLVEVVLPPPLPDGTSASSEFDSARRALDDRRYGDCVGHCRGVIAIWERYLESTSKKRVADVVAERLGWDDEDPRREFVDDLWKAANDLANVAHHPERAASPQGLAARDARLLFYLVAGLSEYLGSV